jgi:hypothetical protein
MATFNSCGRTGEPRGQLEVGVVVEQSQPVPAGANGGEQSRDSDRAMASGTSEFTFGHEGSVAEVATTPPVINGANRACTAGLTNPGCRAAAKVLTRVARRPPAT